MVRPYPYRYPNLTVEMIRNNITIDDLIQLIKPSTERVMAVLDKHAALYYEEFILIRDSFFPNLSITYLMYYKRTKLDNNVLNQIIKKEN